jgi:hypothetical protein
MANETLTNKQQRFCEEYVIDWNATRAPIAAGYSKKTAKEQGYQLLHNSSLKTYISEIKSDLSKLCGITVVSQVKALQDIIDSEKTPIKLPKLFSNGNTGTLDVARLFTLQIFYLFTYISDDTYRSYKKDKDFLGITKEVDLIIYNNKFSEAVAGIFTANIIAVI